MKIFKATKLMLLILFLLLICSEIFFRVKFEEELKDQFSPLIYEPDSVTGYRFIPNSEGEISKPGIPKKKVKINSLGFFTPEFKIEKPVGTYRVILVGTSAGSGIWMHGSDGYFSQLRQKLKKDHQNIELINCSLDGQGLGEGLLELTGSKILKYHPDLILFELSLPVSTGSMFREVYKGYLLQYYTDSIRKQSQKTVDYIENKKVLTFLYDNLYTFRAYCRKYAYDHLPGMNSKLIRTYRDKISRVEEIQEYDYTFAKSMELLKATDSAVAKAGSKLVLFSSGADRKLISPYMAENGLTALFLKCTFDATQISLPDSHLNEKGHKVIADSLYNQLKKHNFFKVSVNEKIL